jgi:pyruvate,orthophosphate dikinase
MKNTLVDFYIIDMSNIRHYFYMVVGPDNADIDSIDNIILDKKGSHGLYRALDWKITGMVETDLDINHECTPIESVIKKSKTEKVKIEPIIENIYANRQEIRELEFRSGLISPDGKYHTCGFADHHNLLLELMSDGTIDVGMPKVGDSFDNYLKLDRNNFHSYPDNNGWFKVRNGAFYYGDLNNKEFNPDMYAIKPTKEQIKTICGEITSHFHSDIKINDVQMNIFDFIIKAKDAKNGIITDVRNIFSKQLVGNKGYNLSMLTKWNITVPKFFIIPSITVKDLSAYEFWKSGSSDIKNDISKELKRYAKNVSVRSSGYISMPGMMDTFLDVEHDQVFDRIKDICESWNSDRALSYRHLMKIDHEPKFAIIIQEMVYGDMDEHSGSGVVLTINPNTGNKELYGEYKPMSKGDHIMSGKTDVLNISELKKTKPNIYNVLSEYAENIERRSFSGKPQEIEFTYEFGTLYILQTRDFNYKERKIEKIDGTILQIGTAASPGIAQGTLVFDQEDIDKAEGDKIFASIHTFEKDMPLMSQCQGILTSIGGTLCHAAIAARYLDIPAVTSAGFSISEKVVYLKGGIDLTTTDKIKINGYTGEILI